MISQNEVLANSFYLPGFGSYLSFELHLTTCDWHSFWTLIFDLGHSLCHVHSDRHQLEPEFFVRTLYDGHPIKFEFCGFREFCGLARFLEFLDLNIYNIKSEPNLHDLVFGQGHDLS